MTPLLTGNQMSDTRLIGPACGSADFFLSQLRRTSFSRGDIAVPQCRVHDEDEDDDEGPFWKRLDRFARCVTLMFVHSHVHITAR